MTESNIFTTTTHAKWILTGEHAVIRGNPALVFPMIDKNLFFKYTPSDNHLEIDVDSKYQETFRIILGGMLLEAMKLLSKPYAEIKGTINIKNNIPMGAGLGFSSALCVALTRWFIWQGWVDRDQEFEFSTKLEHLFH